MTHLTASYCERAIRSWFASPRDKISRERVRAFVRLLRFIRVQHVQTIMGER